MARVQDYAQTAIDSADTWGAAYGVTIPPALVLAVMQRENPRADPSLNHREPDGQLSRGLMQVKESTARELGISDPTRLNVAGIGIDYGVHYLARQLRRYDGNVANAVAAYNAGSVRITSSRQYVNQGYVDAVLGFFRQFAAGVTAVVRTPAGVGVGLFLLGVGLAFAAWKATQPGTSRHARRKRARGRT